MTHRARVTELTCTIDGCEQNVRCMSLCALHYGRLRIHGDALWLPPTTSQKFWAKVDRSGDCWIWTGYLDRGGYGRFGDRTFASPMVPAHRWAYIESRGPVPEGLVLDHLCRTRACVRPSHLEPVTILENFRRGLMGGGIAQRRKTHCPNGHPYSGANLYLVPSTGKRECRTCLDARRRAKRQRQKQEVSS